MAETELFSLDAAFFVPKTEARGRQLTAMRRGVEARLAPAPKTVVFSHAFGNPDGGEYVVMSISYDKAMDARSYYVQLHMHDGPSDHTDPTSDKHPVSWAFEQLLKLLKGSREVIAFFDAEILLPNSTARPEVFAPPLSIGGRVLPVAGVEYAGGIQVGEIERFGWSSRGKGVRVTLSYSETYPSESLPDVLKRERPNVMKRVREVFPQ